MGCMQSRGLDHVDDSVHVMLKHDKKAAQKKGEPVHGYVPRREHPLLKAAREKEEKGAQPVIVATEEGDDGAQ